MQGKILVIWDLMIDKYSFGEVKRLNPEWPNPLLNVEKEEYRLWWSANVAANLSSLDWSCDLIWLVWKDENAKLMNKLCKDKNINLIDFELENFHTILKNRFIETTYNQQLLRVDYEKKINISEEIENNILEKVIKWNYSFIIISDYNKWIITKELIEKIKKIAKERNIKLLADAKPKNYELFEDFYLIKPNFKEFCDMIGKEIENKDSEIEKYWVDFVKKMNTNLVITRWKAWASLITKDGKYYHLETEAKKVFDVSGAGDTFIATIAYALSKWYDVVKAVELWNSSAWVVVWYVGTVVLKKSEFLNLI